MGQNHRRSGCKLILNSAFGNGDFFFKHFDTFDDSTIRIIKITRAGLSYVKHLFSGEKLCVIHSWRIRLTILHTNRKIEVIGIIAQEIQ